MAVGRANMATLHLLLDVRVGKWLCLTWLLMNVLDAQGTASLSDSIVTKARCIANCYTMTGSHNNESEKTCQTTACQECFSPCENWKSSFTEIQCLQTCLNSSTCKASCRFLTHIRNLSSILYGDGSTPPTPGIPTVTNKTFTSISLKWNPVQNTTGTAVYLIAMSITGDEDLTHYFSQVFTTPQAMIGTNLLCALVDRGNPSMRITFDGLYYKFRIAVLTENSSISYGAQTTDISLPQPGPVSNITPPSFEYEASKVKLTVSWTPPGQSQHVSSYAIIWDHKCRFTETAPVSPLLATTGSPHPSGSINLDAELTKCPNYTLKIYALSQCIPSNVTMITYEYPGCRNISSYPKDLCYKFDPPDSPDDYRKVRNVSYTVISIDDAYRFKINVTWDPPIYPYKQLDNYDVFWKRRHADFFEIPGPQSRTSNEASYVVGPLRPGEIYDIKLRPNFEDSAPPGKWIDFVMSTPAIDPHDVTVRNLVVTDFTFSLQTGKFDLNITWLKPSFNYSQMSSYRLSYQVNGGNKIITRTDKPYYTIHGISHGEPVAFNIAPEYSHSWIKGEETLAKSSAPDPDPSLVTVRGLGPNNFTFKLGTYSLNVTWHKPSFNYSNITSYAVWYRVDNGKENITETSKTYFNIDGISHGQPVAFNVTPQYTNTRIRAVTSVMKTKGPVPRDKEISVQQLQQTGDFVEDKQTNTFAVNFTWKPPSFQHRDVLYYNLSYEFSGYPRDELPCSSLVKGPRCTITGVKETKFQLSGIFPQDRVIIEVTPVYNDKYISGVKRHTEDRAPGPREELVEVIGLSHDDLVPISNELFRTRVFWQKPLFNHSEVSHYSFEITNDTERIVGNIPQRRAIDFNTVSTTKNTNVTIDGIQLGKAIEFKVTPVFVVDMVTGREASIAILKAERAGEKESSSMTPGETAGLVIGLLLLILIVICSIIWCHIERQRKMEAKGLISGKNALMIDQWEVDGNLVSLEEELGEGAFGKVYKGALKELSPLSRKPSFKTPMIISRTATIKGKEMFTVAVKMLHNMADGDQRREFLEEIQLMKAVGSHKNIVNMLGCCTVEEPMFLLVEYVPCGDLLHYLRKHRSNVKEYLRDDSRGPYRSTYCETYFTDGSPTGISVKATKSDRIYVNAPDMPKEKNGDIQLLSFNSHNAGGPETGEENRGLDIQEKEDEPDRNEELLTPGDLMAFAWQISQGMEYLAKKGFVHRDLAARNVLVGEKKIAKVADFGLTRHVYEEKVYHAKRNRKLPLKWMSIEAIFDQTFTAQSDVWAFGVVLWELVTLGGTPYPAIDNKELLRLLKDGYRMEKPDTCNDELYNMMKDCWKVCPEARPTFTEIRHKLEEMMQKDNPYLDLSALDESKECYSVPSFNSLVEESTDDLFDKDDQDCRRDSNGKEELDNEKRTANSNGYDAEREEKKNAKNTIVYDGYGKSDDRGAKNVMINFDELEMSVYRPAARGTVF